MKQVALALAGILVFRGCFLNGQTLPRNCFRRKTADACPSTFTSTMPRPITKNLPFFPKADNVGSLRMEFQTGLIDKSGRRWQGKISKDPKTNEGLA